MTARHYPLPARGLALVVVLWTVVLLAVLSGSFLSAMRAEIRMAHNLLAATQARLLAEAGINRAILGLHQPDAARRPVADDRQNLLTTPAAPVRFRVLDETARIDLNKASAELLSGLFAALSIDADISARLIDCILDWRDADALRHTHGAEDGDYRTANLPYDAKDAPFDSVEELLLLPGMTHELYARLTPSLTIHSGQAGIDPTLAAPRLLSAFPGVTREQADAYLTVRGILRDAGRAPPLPDFIDRRYITTGRGLVYTVSASVELPQGGAAAIETTLRIQRNRPDRPVVILRWQETDSDIPAAVTPLAGEENS
ncbi:MAG TPA: hypothetical protein VIR60_04195 [Gammaproteobacteria bacterium]